MKNNNLSGNKNPEHTLFKVVHLGKPADKPGRVRLKMPPHCEMTTEEITMLSFLRVVMPDLEPPSSSEMRAALEQVQPPPLRNKSGAAYRAQYALKQLACGELVHVTPYVKGYMPAPISCLLENDDRPVNTYALPFTRSNLLAAFLTLLSAGWGFPPVGETDFKGWPRIFSTPYGGWGEDEGSEFYDH